MLRNLRPRSHPNSLLPLNILDKVLQRRKPARFPNTPAIQPHRHRFRTPLYALLTQHIKCILDMIIEIHRPTNPRGHVESVVVAVVRVGYYQHPPSLRVREVFFDRDIDPVGYVVGVGVGLPEEGEVHFFVDFPDESLRARWGGGRSTSLLGRSR